MKLHKIYDDLVYKDTVGYLHRFLWIDKKHWIDLEFAKNGIRQVYEAGIVYNRNCLKIFYEIT